MLRPPPRTRRGYTLLEVLLASLIAIILLGALYKALDMMLTRMDVGRSQVDGNDLARAITMTRMAPDLACVLGPLPPKSGGEPAPTSDSSGSGSGSSSPGGTATGSSGSSAGSGTTGSSSGSTTSTTTTGTGAQDPSNYPFAAGVIGTDTQLILFTSRVPDGFNDPTLIANPDPTAVAALGPDVKRIAYWMASDGSGLCRQVRSFATAGGVWNSTDPDFSTESTDVVAREVQSVTFEYYDGGTWQGSWDGSQLATDGVSLLGPPRAIRVTMVLAFPGLKGTTVQKTVQHVFPIRAAVGTYVPATDGTTTGTTTSGGTTTGGM